METLDFSDWDIGVVNIASQVRSSEGQAADPGVTVFVEGGRDGKTASWESRYGGCLGGMVDHPGRESAVCVLGRS